MKSKLQSRKLIVSLALIIFSMVAIIIHLTSFVEGTDFIKWIFGIYAVANTSESIGTQKSQTSSV